MRLGNKEMRKTFRDKKTKSRRNAEHITIPIQSVMRISKVEIERARLQTGGKYTGRKKEWAAKEFTSEDI